MTTWRRGMKATLIEENGYWLNVDQGKETDGPAFGDIVTVSDTFTDETCTWLWFEEWSNEENYDSEHFRPVIERKTDISIFTAMLHPSRQPERETV